MRTECALYQEPINPRTIRRVEQYNWYTNNILLSAAGMTFENATFIYHSWLLYKLHTLRLQSIGEETFIDQVLTFYILIQC